MNMSEMVETGFPNCFIDLLDGRLGGRALACSDEWFAPCSNLVKSGRGIFKEGHFIETGQWMDGWESRRSFGRQRSLDHDWCVVRLAVPGVLAGFDIDTNHFRGNAPEYASVEAAVIECDSHCVNSSEELEGASDGVDWVELLPKSKIQPHTRNLFEICNAQQWTHLRLNIFPDGGVARFRVYGKPIVNRDNYIEGELLDLACATHGGVGLSCSDRFYSSPGNLLMPDSGVNMGDGWETKRRRDDSNDWAIIKLGLTGTIRKVILDTSHFKGNYPDSFTLEACNSRQEDVAGGDVEWLEVISETKLGPDRKHTYVSSVNHSGEVFTHVRLNIYPDGGVSRLRVLGVPNW